MCVFLVLNVFLLVEFQSEPESQAETMSESRPFPFTIADRATPPRRLRPLCSASVPFFYNIRSSERCMTGMIWYRFQGLINTHLAHRPVRNKP